MCKMTEIDIETCYGCQGRQNFDYVFRDEIAAKRVASDRALKIQIGKIELFVSDNGQYEPKRVAIEAMYRSLFNPATYNNNLVDRGLSNVEIHSNGEFRINTGEKRKQPLRAMPTVEEIVLSLERDLGYFEEERKSQKAHSILLDRMKDLLKNSLPS